MSKQPTKKSMKVLILTVTAGAGHNMVAKAVEKKFDENGFETKVLDLFGDQKLISFVLADIGFSLMQVLPSVARKVYSDCVKTNTTPFNGWVKMAKKSIIKHINDFSPDVIISTHVAGSIVTHHFKDKIFKPFVSYFIMTDYSITPSLECPFENEFIVVPTEDFKEQLKSRGFNEQNILPFGIPIDERYYQQLNKEETVKKLGLNDFDFNKKTLLVMGGGNGLGKMFKTVKKLKNLPNIQIITICGKNKTLKNQIDRLKARAKIYNFGYCKNVDEFMTVSDFVFGKAGGITTTEALAKNLTVMCDENLPNPEYENLNYLVEKNCAKKFDTINSFVGFLANVEAVETEKVERNDPSIRHSAQKLLEFHLKRQKTN